MNTGALCRNTDNYYMSLYSPNNRVNILIIGGGCRQPIDVMRPREAWAKCTRDVNVPDVYGPVARHSIHIMIGIKYVDRSEAPLQSYRNTWHCRRASRRPGGDPGDI